MNFHFSKLLSYENEPTVSAVLFGFHGINLFKNLVSREFSPLDLDLEAFSFHFSLLQKE